MYNATFENLPDEIILEICQYLHCSHVLYSFFNLNSRINQTITFYRQHVYFRRASYKILLYIYEYILPQIGSSILSLTIHPLHQASFPSSIDQYISTIFSNLKILTLTSWKSEKLVSFLDILQDMKYLHKLIIQELSCSILIDDRNLIEKVFNNKNSFLTNVIFDYDCDSMNLSNYSLNNIILHNISSLTIQLNTLTDFSRLIHFIPNIQQLDISLKNSSLKTVPFDVKLLHLKIFSLWNINYYSNFDDVISLLTIVPAIEQFSLTISTRDSNLINGEKLFSIFPIQLKKFNYTVCYYLKQDHYPLDINNIINSWQSIPIVYSFSEIDERIFLHTLPYSSSRFIIRSSLAKNFPIKHMYQMYSKASQLHVYTMTNLLDMFPIIGQCRHIRELTLLATNNQSNILDSQCKSTTDNNQQLMKLPYLNRLEILTIEGIPSNLHYLKELFLAAPNLSVLVIDLNCLLTILEDENQSLILYVLFHKHIRDLCIRISDNNETNQLTTEKIHLIGRIFTQVRNLTIDHEESNEYIESNLIRFVVNQFRQLVILHIYGKIPNDMVNSHIRQWFIEQNCFQIKSTDIFRIECSNTWFKLWL